MKHFIIPWFGPDDYQSFLEMVPEADRQGAGSYEDFLNHTFVTEARMRAAGFEPYRVYVSPQTVERWAAAHNVRVTRDLIGPIAGEIHRKIFGLPDLGSVIVDPTFLPPPNL